MEGYNLFWSTGQKACLGAGEMVWCFRVLAALPQDPGFGFQHPHRGLSTACHYRSKGTTALFWTQQSWTQCKYIQVDTHTYT